MTDLFRQVIAEGFEESRKRKAGHKRELDADEAERRAGILDARQWVSLLKDATLADYVAWLRGHIEAGGKPTHFYDYPLARVCPKIAMRDLTITPLYGANSKFVIIPAGIKCTDEGLGHNKVYFMDGFECIGGFVPVYSDMEGL